MAMLESEIRKHVFDACRQDLVRSQGDVHTYVMTRKPPPYELTTSEEATFRRVMWELALQGVIEPGASEVRALLQGANLTEYGRLCVQQEQTLPHDSEGYLRALKDRVGSKPDDLIMQYTTEALECFHRNNLRAAVVMLGVAAERSLELLKAAYADSLGGDERAKAEQKLNARHLRDRFEYLWKRVREMDLPSDLQDRLEGDFWGAFQLVRKSRNDAGHFTPVETDKLTALACFASFTGFVDTLSRLVERLSATKKV